MFTGETIKANRRRQPGLASFVVLSTLLLSFVPIVQDVPPQSVLLSTGVDTEVSAWEESATTTLDTFAHNKDTSLASPFVQDEPLADGRRMLTVSSSAQHYQAEDGDWLPIDARFSPAEGGFTNFTNALRLSAGETTALLNMRNGETRLQWQALELLATTEQGDQVALAQALDAASAQTGALVDGDQTIRYANSWTLAGVVEEITAGPGAVEQRLMIASRSVLPAKAEDDVWETLKLLAIVRLSPSATLFAEGVLQGGAFTTAGRVEVRDAGSNTVLAFEPVIAYEQHNPTAQTAGQYTFTPVGEGEWQVAVQTPWAWWADPARGYPVVLDPTMKMLGSITTAHICAKYSSNCPANSLVDPETGSKAIYIGTNYLWGKVEALIRFDNLPTLPPGYVVEQADLLIAPKNHLSSYQTRQIRVWQVTSAWDPTTVGYYPNSPPVAYPHLDQKSLVTGVKPAIPVKAEAFVTRFHLQTEPGGLVSGWLSGAIANNGLLLQQYPENNCSNCVDYATIFTDPLWTKNDVYNLDPKKPFTLSASEGSGIMLQIVYAPPTLALNQPVFSSLPTFGEIYVDTYHAYLPPASTSTWTAIAVKGLNEVQDGDAIIDKAAGNLRLARGCTNPFAAGCMVKPSEGAFLKRPNFILARGNPADTDMEAWLYPPNPAAPANANLDVYMIAAVPSVNVPGNPVLAPGAHITHTLVMSTSEIMQLHNLNLQANTRIGVRVRATAIDPANGYPTDMPYIDARLYPPKPAGATLVKDIDGQYIGGHNAAGMYEFGKVKVGASQGGTWALALEYFGDVDPSIGEPPITYTYPLTMALEVTFVACAANGIPTENGCLTVNQPTVSTPFMDVGNFRVFNDAGFTCNGTLCSTVTPTGPGATAPAIVWKADWLAGQQDRWVAVTGSPITFDTATMYFLVIGNMWLASDTASGLEMLELFTGVTVGYPGVNNPGDPTYARLIPLASAVYATPPLALSDTNDLQINVNVDRQVAEASTTLVRQIKTSPAGLEDFTFTLRWEVRAEGYTTLANKTLTPVSYPPDAEVASLTLLFGSAWTVDYSDAYMPNGRFTNLRNLPGAFGDSGVGAKVAAPASLGSNWKGVTALLLPVGENLPDSDAGCPGDCLDIRAANDTPAAPNRTWGLPDLNISGQAQTLFFNKPGELTVFSTDHPNAVQAVSVPFSFRTFEGDVSVDVKVCPKSGSPEKVVVITGHSKIALPGLGSDTNPATMIGATFILCETSLREVSMQFQGPPDIPAGSTGVLINFVKGDVLIGPSNTQITFDLEYHDNSNVVDGAGTVTINTAGLFDLQTSGKVLAKVNYNGHAWVAWNPLDVGVDVKAWYGSWLQGNVHAHLWKGQGWQNKYHWLPNDNATHFAGSIAASIDIKAGQAFSCAFIEIPPWDISFGITVAFGEFCKNSACSTYEWGIKGKFTVIGYDVGFFYGFQSGFKFILGSDGHVLIDQYATTAAASQSLLPDADMLAPAGPVARAPNSAGKPLALTRIAVADPLAATETHPLAVTAFTGSFIAGLTWSQGAPALSLIRPDGVVITPANAAAYGVTVVSQPASILFGVANPMPGTWQATIGNTAADNDYHFVWFANKTIPDVHLLSPAGTVDLSANVTSYNVQWTVPTFPAGVDVRVSLYYSVTNSTALTATQAAGVIIRENLPLSDGGYAWDLSSLAYGHYRVYARVYSGQPDNAPLEPTPTVTGTDQLPGEAWIIAPGVIRLLDAVAPAIPANVAMIPIADGFWACWPHNVEKDLAGYVVRYFSPDVFGAYHQHDLRVHAEVAEPNTGQQCTRLGGFNAGEQIMVQVAAYDASGNLSAFSDLNEAIAEGSAPSQSPDPGELIAVVTLDHYVTLTWGLLSLPRDGGVWLYTSRGLPLANGRQVAPENVGNLNEITLGPLDAGFVWFFGVQTHDDRGRLSRLSNVAAVLVSDGVDRDGDGLPDDWESAYEIDDPLQDEDGDGLSNAEEARYRTHPHYPDTDGDGFSDGTEIAGGSDPLDPNSTPATYENYTSGLLPLPELSVEPRALTLRAYTGGPAPAAQHTGVFNLGGGVLAPVIADDVPWLMTTLDGETLSVHVDQTGLPAGHYRAVITVAGTPGSLTQNSPQSVVVDLWLLAGAPPAYGKVYLPLILSLYSD